MIVYSLPMRNQITEADWANYQHYNMPGYRQYTEYRRADRDRCERLDREIKLSKYAHQTSLFRINLDAANVIALNGGLPEMTLEDAVVYYGGGGHDYNPNASDRGSNNAAAGSDAHYARWEICVTLHEGSQAVQKAKDTQNEAATQYWAVASTLQRGADAINALTRTGNDL